MKGVPMAHTPDQHIVLHLTDYGAPYAGNFIASLSALEQFLSDRGGRMVYALPPRASERAWAQDFSQSHDVRFLKPGGFFSYYHQFECCWEKRTQRFCTSTLFISARRSRLGSQSRPAGIG
jgi:hypothetical protein